MKGLFGAKHVTVVVLFLSQGISSEELNVGDPCRLNSTGSRGICKLVTECQSVLEQLQTHQVFPQNCGFEGAKPVVCCPRGGRPPPGEISDKKCKEYSEFVFESEESGIKKNKCVQSRPISEFGSVALRGEFPNMAILGYVDSKNKKLWLCPGSIISERYILTSAHCLNSLQFGGPRYVRVGVANLTDEGPHSQIIKVTEVIPHPDYKRNSLYNDIGLLKLEKSIEMSPYTRPACLFTNSELSFKSALDIFWKENNVHKIVLDILPTEICNKTYEQHIDSKLLARGFVEDSQICASSKDEESSCDIKPSGPLQIYRTKDNLQCMYDVVGFGSFGAFCSTKFVYTRISHFIEWIEDTVWPEAF